MYVYCTSDESTQPSMTTTSQWPVNKCQKIPPQFDLQKFHNSLSLGRVVSNFFWVSSLGLFSPPKNLNLFEWWVNYKIQATHNQDALLYYHQNPLEKHAVTNIPHNESEQQDMTMCQILIYFFIVCFISRQVAIWETLFYFLVTFQKQNKIFRTYLYWDKCWNLETANLGMLQLGHLIYGLSNSLVFLICFIL